MKKHASIFWPETKEVDINIFILVNKFIEEIALARELRFKLGANEWELKNSLKPLKLL